MKILKPGKFNLACLIFGHRQKASDIENRYIGGGMYEFTHTCDRCGKKTTYAMSEKALGLPAREKPCGSEKLRADAEPYEEPTQDAKEYIYGILLAAKPQASTEELADYLIANGVTFREG